MTHDRRLIDAVANVIWEVKPGQVDGEGSTLTVYPGTLRDYLTTWKRLAAQAGAGSGPGSDPPGPGRPGGQGGPPRPGPGRTRRPNGREAELRKEIGRQTKRLREEVDRLEELSSNREAKLAQVNAALADPAVYSDPAEAAKLSRRATDLREELARLQEEWARASLNLETAQEEASGNSPD